MKARFAAVLIALCLLVAIVGFSSVLSDAIGISGGESAPPPVTTSAPSSGSATTEAPVTSPAQTVTETGIEPGPTTTVAQTPYIERDSTLTPDTPALSPSVSPSSPITTPPTSVPSATIETSTPASTPAVTDTTEKASPSKSDGSITVHISADGEEYSPSKITVPAGSRVTLVFENQDVDIPHNVVIYEDKAAPIFVGTIVEGPGRTTDTFTAPSTPGAYTFGCSIPSPHRKGTFIVE